MAAAASVPYFPAPERRRDLPHGLAALEWGSVCSVGSRTRPRIRPGEGLNDVCSAWEHNASIVESKEERGVGGAGKPALIRASFTLERFHSSASSILPRLLAPIPWPALSPGAFLFGLVLFYFQSRAASVYKVKVFV